MGEIKKGIFLELPRLESTVIFVRILKEFTDV